MDRIRRKGHLSRWIYRRSRKKKPLPERIYSAYSAVRGDRNGEVICYAPFRNLYFSADGKVLSCCFNRRQILGYCTENLAELWRGAALHDLRRAILHTDLGMGCGICETMLREGNFSGAGARVYDDLDSAGNLPAVIEFELSNTCNLQCIMCSPRFSSSLEKNQKLPESEMHYDNSFVERLSPLIPGLRLAKFLGGEPFLINIYQDIWDKIIRENPECLLFVQTNGTVLNDRIKALLEQGNFRLGISLESLHPETWKAIRKGGDYERFAENLEYFREHAGRKGYTLGFSVCFMYQNRLEIPSLIRTCSKQNIRVNFNTVWNPPECAVWNKPSAEIEALIRCYSNEALPVDSETARANANAFDDLMTQLKAWHREAVRYEEAEALNAGEVRHEILDEELFLHFSDTIRKATPQMRKKIPGLASADESEIKLRWVMEHLPDGFPVNTALSEAIENAYAGDIIINCSRMTREELLADLMKKYHFTPDSLKAQRTRKFPGEP